MIIVNDHYENLLRVDHKMNFPAHNGRAKAL